MKRMCIFLGIICVIWMFPIIMMQKVAAIVNKVAADLGFRAYDVRWLLPEKYFDSAASSAAGLLCLYIIGVLNTQRFSVFVPNI